MDSSTSGNIGSAVPDPPKAANLADPIETYPMSMAEPVSTSDKVTSVILNKDDPVPDDLEDDDDEDDIVTSRKRGGKSNGINGVDVEDEMEDEDEDDLFGDGADDDEGGDETAR